jgi:hypothetical protein
MRQQRLLGGALLIVPGEPAAAAVEAVCALLGDPVRLQTMGATGRARMGGAGGAAAIAAAVADVARPSTGTPA